MASKPMDKKPRSAQGMYSKYIFGIVLLLVLGFIFRESLGVRWRLLSADLFPCKNPITYSIGAFDTRFGISKESFLKAVREAETVWEKPIDRELFSYAPDGYLRINLVYDYRQNTTQTLQRLGFKVDQNKASYEALKQNYESMVSQFEQTKSVLEPRMEAFDIRRNIYESDVRRANRQKNISKEEYERLRAEGDSLEREIVVLNEMRADLRKKVEDINVLAGALNDLAKALNLDVAHYNEIGDSFGSEFTQGLYESHGEGEGITIFQYNSYGKLVRVLAHELGHALSLEHLDNAGAIMYRLNEGDNETITLDDLLALKTRCRIK
ncbi:MAG: matrixin family metalloprotease [bacterium]|nr:matrixin family metalloprotease [bacterium]